MPARILKGILKNLYPRISVKAAEPIASILPTKKMFPPSPPANRTNESMSRPNPY